MINKYRKVLLCFIIIIVVIIIIDLVFNFRGIFLENYKRYTESNKVETFDGTTVSIGGNQGVTISTPNSNSNQNPQNLANTYTSENSVNLADLIQRLKARPDKHVRSIVSKNSGKIINVEPVDIYPPTTKFIVKFKGQALTSLNDGLTGLSMSDKLEPSQQFELIYITNSTEFDAIIPDESKLHQLGNPTNTEKYPFYIARNVKNQDKGLFYDSGHISVRGIANYEGFKFDLSYSATDNTSKVPTHNSSELLSVLSNDFRASVGDSPNEISADPDKIKINLNLGSDALSSLLGGSIGNNYSVSRDISNNSGMNTQTMSNSQMSNSQMSNSQMNNSQMNNSLRFPDITNIDGFTDGPRRNTGNNINKDSPLTSDMFKLNNNSQQVIYTSDFNRSDIPAKDPYCSSSNYIPRDSVSSLCPGCNIKE